MIRQEKKLLVDRWRLCLTTFGRPKSVSYDETGLTFITNILQNIQYDRPEVGRLFYKIEKGQS